MSRVLIESLAAHVKTEPTSAAAQEAKRLGVKYAGFGRYVDAKNEVAYIVYKGKLIPFKGTENARSQYDKAKTMPKLKASEVKAGKPDKRAAAEKEANTYLEAGAVRQAKDSEFMMREYAKAEKVNRQLNKAHAELFANMDDFTKETLFWYSGEGFAPVNRYLYKGHDEGASSTNDRELVRAINTIDNAINNSPAPMAYTTYMGLSERYKSQGIEPGETYHFRGYLSTTLDVNKSFDFTNEKSKEGRVVLQIEVPQGQPALHTDQLATMPEEFETILPRGSMIQVVSGPHIIQPSFMGKEDGSEGDIHLFHCLLVPEDGQVQ